MIINKLYRKVIGLSNFIDKLTNNDYYNNASNIALKNYKIFSNYLIENFDKIDPFDYQKLFILMNSQIIPDVRYVQRTTTKNIPWSLVSNLDQMLKNELDDSYLLLFRPQWKFNYSVFTDDLITYFKNILIIYFPEDESNITNEIFSSEKIHVFSFPFLEKTNVLLNSIIGHEIGHFFHKNWQSTDYAKLKSLEFQKQLKSYYQKIYTVDLFKPYEKTDEGIRILSGMYREIISDMFGYSLFGPSMLFSLFELITFETKYVLPNENNNYYPILKYRIRILYEKVLKDDEEFHKLMQQDGECKEILTNHLREIEAYLSDENDTILYQQIQKEIELFESTLPDIISYVNDTVTKQYFSSSLIEKLFKKLDGGIPINELDGSPIDITEILFTGWIKYLKINNEYQGDKFINEYQILMRLLLKSLHSSFIHKKYLTR